VLNHLELCRHAAIASGDTKEKSIILRQRVRSSDRIIRLGRGMHQFQNVLWKCLWHSEVVIIRNILVKVKNYRLTGRFSRSLLAIAHLL